MDMESTTVLKKGYGVETPAMYPHVKVYKEMPFLLKYVIIVVVSAEASSITIILFPLSVLTQMVKYTVSLKACESLINIPHGHVAYQTIDTPTVLPGDVALYSCDAPYSLLGSEYRICLRNGSWSDSEPLCVGRWW